ncbi:MAG TPA: FkbM family methyltransferase [Alphaproteobacteria bacterium]|nr:FkbM family methyltransferase [Alphaproteobacteria bacterium]
MTSDLELNLIAGLTRHLPAVRGAGVLANFLIGLYNRKSRPPVEVEANGIRLRLWPRDSLSEKALTFYPQLYDRHEFAYLRRRLQQGDLFVDVGAHIGAYTLAAAKLVGGEGRVITLEAFSPTFEKLLHNVELNQAHNVTARNVGVSDATEKLRLAVNAKNSGGNSFRSRTGEFVDVDCLPLLDLLRDADVPAVTGMKLDIEGFECRVLGKFFADAPVEMWPEFMIVEESSKSGGGDSPVRLLTGQGYDVVWQGKLNCILERSPSQA